MFMSLFILINCIFKNLFNYLFIYLIFIILYVYLGGACGNVYLKTGALEQLWNPSSWSYRQL